MDSQQIRLLLLEDNPDHVDLFLANLEMTSFASAQVDSYESLSEGLSCLKKDPYDLVFIDLSLKDSVVVNTLGQLKNIAATCPVIVITSLDDKETLLDIIHKGADDCLPKSELSDFTLERIIHYNLDRSALKKQVVESEAAYKDLYHNSPIYHATFDLESRKIISCNETLASSIGWSSNDLIGMDVISLYHADSVEEAESIHSYLIESEGIDNRHLLLVRKDGTARDVLLNISVVRGFTQKIKRCHATWVDTTERVKARAEVHSLQRRQSQILDSIQEPVWLKDLEGKFIACNKSFCLFVGEKEEDIVGKTSNDFFSNELCDVVLPLEKETGTTGKNTSTEAWVRTPASQDDVLLEITKTPLIEEDGSISGVVGYGYDITEHHQLTKQLEHAAEHDNLTQLPNRFLFTELFEQMVSSSDRHKFQIALLFIDLDGFKQINDTYGHEAGDQVLIAVSKRMREAIREEDLIARHGGDEFIAAITSLAHRNDATPLIQRILDRLQDGIPINTKGREVCVNTTVSIGVAFYSPGGAEFEALLKDADEAMYEAKASGKNCFIISEKSNI